jgi:ABC-type nitrate/sulfonate/bicarbonate transport system substrate-binding protein
MKTNEVILNGINEEFKAIGVKSLDSKNRLNIGEKILRHLKVDAFEVFIGEGGDILLRPVVNIPSREAWIYQNPNILKRIQKGLKDAQEGKIKQVKNVQKFLNNL